MKKIKCILGFHTYKKRIKKVFRAERWHTTSIEMCKDCGKAKDD